VAGQRADPVVAAAVVAADVAGARLIILIKKQLYVLVRKTA